MAFAGNVIAAKAAATARGRVLTMPNTPAEDGRARGVLTVAGADYPVVIDDWDEWPAFLQGLGG